MKFFFIKYPARGALFPVLVLVLAGVMAAPALMALPEFQKNEEPTAAQIEIIKDLENRIYDIRKRIESYHDALAGRDFIDKEGKLTVPLNAQFRAYYGRRTRNVFNEVARMRWKDKRIVDLVLVQRVARYGRERITLKKWYAELSGREEKKTGKDGKPEVNFIFEGIGMNLVVARSTGSTYWEYVNFRFFTGADVRKVKKDIKPPKDAGDAGMRVHGVRRVNQRIAMLREYRRFLILLQRRVDWLVRSVKDRDSSDLDGILRDK